MSRFVLSAGMVGLLLSALTLAAQVREPRQTPPPTVQPKAAGQKALTPDEDVPARKKAPADQQSRRRHRRVYLGVYTVPVEDMDSRTRRKLKLEKTEGVIIVEVMPDSPADEAGLRHGDVIVRVNGKPVDDEEELSKDLNQLGPGKPVTLSVIRDGKKQEIKAELEESPHGEHSAYSGHHEDLEEMMGICQRNAQRIEHLERKIMRLEKRLAEMGKGGSIKEPQ